MDCNVIKDLIPLYIDGCCSPESADLVRAHIGGCEECRSLWETMKQGPETASSRECSWIARVNPSWTRRTTGAFVAGSAAAAAAAAMTNDDAAARQ